MATDYADIYSLFLSSVRDFLIDRLYNKCTKDAEEYMKPFLIRAIPNFKKCKKNLEDRDDSTQKFDFDLTTDEKVILSNLMRIEWLTAEINNILDMKNHLQDSDFKTYSAANLLKEKRELLNTTREVVDKQIVQYGYDNLDWSML